MNRIIASIIVCLMATAAGAQQKAEIVVSYNYQNINRFGEAKAQKMTLLANGKIAKYFNDISLWTDSLESTPEGKAKLNDIIRATCLVKSPEGYDYWDLTKGPIKNIYTYVFTDTGKEELTVYDEWGKEPGYYTESLSEQAWTVIPDSTVSLLGYECLLAETNYHGRVWKAWFTPEIPIPFGPWKLHGTPGLILKAYAEGGFLFQATGMENTERQITPMYSKGNYILIDREKALSNHEYFINNEQSILAAQNGGNAKITYHDDNGNEIAAPVYDGKLHSLEPDYKIK